MGLMARNFARTRITRTNGAYWEPLQAPSKYADKGCELCQAGEEDCYLHLSGPSQWTFGTRTARPTYYHHENAPGVLVANGNVGKYLDLESEGCTFMSRDGGVSWEQISEGINVYEFGDHGALMIRVKHSSSGATQGLFFSTDEGRCWHGPLQLQEP